jgi:hypothetical protein
MPIADDVVLAHNARLFHPELVNLYGFSIGTETRIGTFVEIQNGAVSWRHMYAPQFETAEALRSEAVHFVNGIENRERPISDAESGLRVVRILGAASRSMAERGGPVEF